MSSFTVNEKRMFIKKRIDNYISVPQSIKETSEQEAKEKKFTLDECNKSINRILNRYRDVSPYDHSRIVLQRGDCDYINANLVKVRYSNRIIHSDRGNTI